MAEGKDSAPIKFKVKKFFDSLSMGRENVDHFHSEPISSERADELYSSMRNGLDSREVMLLEDYERAQVYSKLETEGRVLVLASGYDGLPSQIFGEKRVTMLSLDAEHYFSPYLSWLAGTEQTRKVEAEMAKAPVPFVNGSFSLVLINGMGVFGKMYLQSPVPEINDPKLLEELFRETRRIVPVGGKFVITDSLHSPSPKREFLDSLGVFGWKPGKPTFGMVSKAYEFDAV